MINEAFRFMRFGLPGLACMIELVLAMAFFHPEILKTLGEKLPEQSPVPTAVGILVVTFIASGAFGYLLANIYFAIYWLASERIGIDHTPVFENLRRSKRFRVLDLGGNDITDRDFSRRQAWMMVTQYQDSQQLLSKQMEGLRPHLDLLVDVFRGVGTTIVGTVFCAGLYFLLACRHGSAFSPGREFMAVVYWFLLSITLCKSYLYAREALEKMSNSIVVQLVREQMKKRTVTIYFQP